MKRSLEVVISGCDDETVFAVEVTEQQYKELRALAALSRRNSEFSCQPSIFLRERD